jgi:hypothetical protein
MHVKGIHMRATAFLASITLSTALFGCTAEGELTGIICDCEHCNDWEEEETLAGLETSADIADVYGCTEDWDAYVQCQIDRGTCDEVDANWSAQAPGSCSATMDLMTPCMTDAECTAGPGGATCNVTTMTCFINVCAGGGGQCDTDADCQGGQDLCQTQQDNLNDCINDGSSHNIPRGP